MGAGASAPTSTPVGGKGGGSSPTAQLPPPPPPPPPAPYDPDLYYGTNTKTPVYAPAPVAMPAPAVAPTAPQQPYVNPFMQTYGQNNTPQQQAFNRFPQKFQQPQPVAQPTQGPVYADQSLNALGNQPQQFQQQPQYDNFGRGFMPQNRGGYERQMDQLRGQGQYGQQPIAGQPSAPVGGKGGPTAAGTPAPSAAPRLNPFPRLDYEAGFTAQRGFHNGETPALNTQASGAGEAALGQKPIPAYAQPYMNSLLSRQQPIAGQLNPFQAALVKGGTPYVQDAPGAPYAIGQNIPGGAPGGYMPLMNSNGTPVSSLASANPAGGKGGNPTAQLPPPPKQDGTLGSWSTYI